MSEADADQASSFDKFMLAEYEHIARAHFATIETLSTFFRHYILIVSLPLPVAAVFLHPSWWTVEGGRLDAVPLQFLRKYPSALPIAIWALVLAGIAVLWYMINLRHDAILYARTVNGIRRYFYGRSDLHWEDELRIRVLPKSIRQPSYYEPLYFGLVVLAVGIVHVLYAAAGSFIWYELADLTKWAALGVWAVPIILPLIHVLVYERLSHYREGTYLRSKRMIGVDIDGVLNHHREHFCELLEMYCHKPVGPDQITTIPVHLCEGLGVTRADEATVFNHPQYWTKMPCAEEAADVLSALREGLGYTVLLFTHRPWPNFEQIPDQEDELAPLWREQDIESMTRSWLDTHGIPFDELVIEKDGGSSFESPTGGLNRFLASHREEIPVFVEDDLAKATRLAGICDVVFLIDHPYNQASDGKTIPRNLIRVSTWQEIWEHLRMASE